MTGASWRGGPDGADRPDGGGGGYGPRAIVVPPLSV